MNESNGLCAKFTQRLELKIQIDMCKNMQNSSLLILSHLTKRKNLALFSTIYYTFVKNKENLNRGKLKKKIVREMIDVQKAHFAYFDF